MSYFNPFERAKELNKDNQVNEQIQTEAERQEEAEFLEKYNERERLKNELIKDVKKYIAEKRNNEKMETITFTPSFYELDKEDFNYIYFFVNDNDENEKLLIEHSGLNYTITLRAGLNKLNVLHGVYIKTAGKHITGKLLKTTYELD